MNIQELKALLRENGIVGAGGAGFPTYAKLDTRADTLILNCAECEPLLRLHRQVLELYTYEILSTLHEISKILEVENVLLGIEGSYKNTLAAVEAELASFPNMKISKLPEVYPAGDEVVLTYEAAGRVVPAGGIPWRWALPFSMWKRSIISTALWKDCRLPINLLPLPVR